MMHRAPSWISLWLTPNPKAMEAECDHGRTRTHWHARGPAPHPQELAVLAILGHQVRIGCDCGRGMWQPPDPRGNCLARASHGRALPADDLASLAATVATPPVYWQVYQ